MKKSPKLVQTSHKQVKKVLSHKFVKKVTKRCLLVRKSDKLVKTDTK